MFKKIRKYILSIVLLSCLIFSLPYFSEAATISVNANTSLEVGESTSFSISIPGVSGRCNITSSNSSAVALSASTVWVEKGVGDSITLTAKAAGSSTITVTPQTLADDTTGDDIEVGSKQITITVNEKKVETTTSNNNQNNTTTTNNTTAATTTTTKSSNNYLSSLTVSEEGLTPNFVKTKNTYSLNVSEQVNSIQVNAIPEDSTASVYVSGNENLQEGDNNIYITVVAQNGYKRTYTIIVNKSSDPEKSNSYLANLIIKDMVLTPEFSKEVLEYDGGTVATNDTKLDIYAYPENDNAKVEITGNENLIVGENKITIKVISENETSTKEYVITFIKEEKEVVDIVESNPYVDAEENSSSFSMVFKSILNVIKNNALVLLMYLLIIVEYIQIVYLYRKLKKKEQQEKNNVEVNENNINNLVDKVDDSVTLGHDMVEHESKELSPKPLTYDDIVNDENSCNEVKKRRGKSNTKSDSKEESKDLTEETKSLESTIYNSIDKDLEDINKKLDNVGNVDLNSENIENDEISEDNKENEQYEEDK